ncbi:MAG: hypothetical protein U9N83_15855, partial [Thermodesulfobacteriota bacterium]|nr:hypothetical protein [Thermodesulfobacteriota bacterium]
LVNQNIKTIERTAFFKVVSGGFVIKKKPRRHFAPEMGKRPSWLFYLGNLLWNLQTARFKDIKSYDISCFDMNPYGRIKRTKNAEPSFFIAYAKV